MSTAVTPTAPTALDRTKKAAAWAGHATWSATKWTAVVSWKITLVMLIATWAATKWSGRVALWLIFWPVGLWRSIHHGKSKRFKKEQAAAERRHRELMASLNSR